jgi:hypothetical protein
VYFGIEAGCITTVGRNLGMNAFFFAGFECLMMLLLIPAFRVQVLTEG